MKSFREFWIDSEKEMMDRLLSDPFIKKLIKDLDLKEVKKVNKIPYFEMKVVKIKGEKREKHKCERLKAIWDNGGEYPTFKCEKCGTIYTKDVLSKLWGVNKKQRKGNWVNGECIDKIKFPVPCSYIRDNEKKYGFFSMNNGYYYIADLIQKKIQNDIQGGCYDLKEFIVKNNIHILRGKIIIFDDDMEDKYSDD